MSDKIESINMSVAVFSANLVTVKDVEEFVRVASSEVMSKILSQFDKWRVED